VHHRSSQINPITQTASARVVFSGKDYSGASLSVSVPQTTESSTGKKKFELTKHLGKVLALIGDRKQKSQQSNQH
jgi:hypothetical protein